MLSMRAWLVLIFIGVLAIAWHRHALPLWLILAYGLLNVLSFIMYAIDKSAARRQEQRTPERTLHLLSLAGGWGGALLGQQLLRHKSSKQSFLRIFWLTLLLHCAGLSWYLTRNFMQ